MTFAINLMDSQKSDQEKLHEIYQYRIEENAYHREEANWHLSQMEMHLDEAKLSLKAAQNHFAQIESVQ